MQLEHKLMTKKAVDTSQTFSDIKENVSIELDNPIKSEELPQRQVNIENSVTDKIYLMDISSDMQWKCCVSQFENSTGTSTTTLSIRKFSAIDDESSEKEYFTPTLNNSIPNLHESRVEIKIDLESDLRSICINEYFNAPNLGHKFLSISPDGQYISLSTYDEEKDDTYGLCIIFIVRKTDIALHCKLKCNGRAIFLNRENELCLAIINTEILKIYGNIRDFSTDFSYALYDLTPFDAINSRTQYLHTDFVSSWAVSRDPNRMYRSYPKKVQDVIALSTYVKRNILLTPFASKIGTIRLWSLKNNGVRLASIVAPKEAVIAVSEDLKFIATAESGSEIKTAYTVNVYNLENGCLAYTLKSHMPINRLTDAVFCNNSRYLAISAVQWNPEQKILKDKYKAAFEVWHISEQKSIFAATKSVGQALDGAFNQDRTQVKILKPFILEIMSRDSKPNLKGFYYHSNEEGTNVTTMCFNLNIDDEKAVATEWLVEDEMPPEDDIDFSFYVGNMETLDTYGSDDTPEYILNKSLDQQLNEYFATDDDDLFEIIDAMDYHKRLKCGFINSGKSKFLVRCGYYMVQLWQLVEGLSDLQKNDMQNYKLVYIKPFTNCDSRSYYLSPNIWRIESFESMKIFGGPQNPKMTLNIIEDNRYLRQRKKELIPYTEEFILPIVGDDNAFDYKKFEGACQTLYFLNIFFIEKRAVPYSVEKVTKKDYELKTLFEKCLALITGEIGKMDESCNSFKTIDGSKMLGMLASFEKGRDILKLLLKNEAVSFNISSYSVTDVHGIDTINLAEEIRYDTADFKFQYDIAKTTSAANQPVASKMTESVLTILIREREYNLYHLLLNRILSDSKNTGPECLSVLNDALLLLQSLGNTDHYQKSCQKLSYLPIGNGSVLPSEIPREIPQKADEQEDLIANIGNMFFFSAMEQISIRNHKFGHSNSNSTMITPLRSLWNNFNVYFKDKHKKPSSQFVTCVVPLSHFNTYYRTSVHDDFINYTESHGKKNGLKQSSYKKESTFLQLALEQHSEPNIWRQGDDVMAILLQYKWNAFIRKRFFLVCIIYVVYYISYSTGVQFALEMYNYDSSNEDKSITANSKHVVSLTLFFLSGFILLLLELNQILRDRKVTHYFKSWYNFVDLAAIVLPFITFSQLILNWNYFYEVSSVCTLILWLHGIVRLRVFSSFGIALETIIQLFRKVNSVLFILLIVVFGFTHSFIVLLRQQEDQYFQDNYGGEIALDGQSPITGNSTLYDLSSSNGFKDPFKAFYQVWLFIFGVWDPITAGDAGDSQMLFLLCILFAFITVLIFTNMIIALMSSIVEEVKQRGKKVWMTHFAAVIAEIENLTSMETRLDRRNNPAFIFYAGNAEKVKIQQEKLRQETLELRKLLLIDVDEQMEAVEKLEKELKRLYQLLTPVSH